MARHKRRDTFSIVNNKPGVGDRDWMEILPFRVSTISGERRVSDFSLWSGEKKCRNTPFPHPGKGHPRFHSTDGTQARDLPGRKESWEMRRLAGPPLPGDDCSMEGKQERVVGLCNSCTNGWAQFHHHLSIPKWPRIHWNLWYRIKVFVPSV